jgi:hypothetical protein
VSAYSRLNRDRKLGYAGLLVGAAAFVALMIGQGSILDEVRDRLPEGIPGATNEAPAIKGEPQKGVVIALRAARQRDDRGSTPSSTGSTSGGDGTSAGGAPQSNGGSGPAANVVPGTQPQPGPGHGGPGDGGPGPGGPGTTPGNDDGPVSSFVDPVVTGVTDTVDGATGGATTPVTGVVDDTVDGVTDVVDGLLGLGNGHASAQGASHANSHATDKTKKHAKNDGKGHAKNDGQGHAKNDGNGHSKHHGQGHSKHESKHPGKHHSKHPRGHRH